MGKSFSVEVPVIRKVFELIKRCVELKYCPYICETHDISLKPISSVVNKAKERISKRIFQGSKAR